MTSLREMFPKAHGLVQELHNRTRDLEYNLGRLSDVEIILSELNRLLQLCDSLVPQERREVQATWRAKLQELCSQRDDFHAYLTKFQRARGSEIQLEMDKEKLLNRRRAMPEFMVDAYEKEGASVGRSQKTMGSVMDIATGSLTMLREQRETLKHAQRLGFDILNRLGVSQSLMRAVEKRETQDRIILVVGMLLTLAVLYFVIQRKSQ